MTRLSNTSTSTPFAALAAEREKRQEKTTLNEMVKDKTCVNRSQQTVKQRGD